MPARRQRRDHQRGERHAALRGDIHRVEQREERRRQHRHHGRRRVIEVDRRADRERVRARREAGGRIARTKPLHEEECEEQRDENLSPAIATICFGSGTNSVARKSGENGADSPLPSSG